MCVCVCVCLANSLQEDDVTHATSHATTQFGHSK